jgi:hypothetical protein
MIGNIANDACACTNQRVLADRYAWNDSGPGPQKSKPPDFYIPGNAAANGDMGPFFYPAVVVDRRTGIDDR